MAERSSFNAVPPKTDANRIRNDRDIYSSFIELAFYTRKRTPAGGGGRRVTAEEGWYCRTSSKTSFASALGGVWFVRPSALDKDELPSS